MSDWNANQYLRFKNQRTQPAVDLAMHVANRNPGTVVDIGCGPGNSTAVLKSLIPSAEIIGIDNSLNMIEKRGRSIQSCNSVYVTRRHWRANTICSFPMPACSGFRTMKRSSLF